LADVVLLIVLVVFFALAVAFVRACDRIIGPDAEVLAVGEESEQLGQDAGRAA
jgi:hypothetical protein